MSNSMKKLVLIGDSIRMGYENEVKKLLADKVEIFAPVENGGNSRRVKSKLDEWVIDQSPDILHINCGLHDIKREFSSGEVAVSLSEYKINLQYILTVVSSKVETVIWATTTPVNSEWHQKIKDLTGSQPTFQTITKLLFLCLMTSAFILTTSIS